MFQLKCELLFTQIYMTPERIRIYVFFDIACLDYIPQLQPFICSYSG